MAQRSIVNTLVRERTHSQQNLIPKQLRTLAAKTNLKEMIIDLCCANPAKTRYRNMTYKQMELEIGDRNLLVEGICMLKEKSTGFISRIQIKLEFLKT